MAEDTTQSRLAGKVEAYRKARNARKLKAVRALFGLQTGPSIEQMAAFNESLTPSINKLAEIQGKVYDNEAARTKERAATLRSVVGEMRSIINTRATQATGFKKKQLEEYGDNMDFLMKGLQDAEDSSGSVDDTKIGPEKLRTKVGQMYTSLGGDKVNVSQVARRLATDVPNDQERAQAIEFFNDMQNEGGDERLDATLLSQEANAVANKMRVLMPETSLRAAGVDPSNKQGSSFYTQGYQLGTDPDSVMTLFLTQEQRIEQSRPSYGGTLTATLADLASGLSQGSTRDIREAFDDLIGEAGLSEDEAKFVSNQDRQKEGLMGMLYNPNAPSEFDAARAQLTSDAGFLDYKDRMGFNSDQAAFISLKRQMRKKRREDMRADRRKLNDTRPGRSSASVRAFEALQQRESDAKKVADDAAATKSAQVAQVAEPDTTTVNTGANNGRQGQG